jgi:hypothetical protein
MTPQSNPAQAMNIVTSLFTKLVTPNGTVEVTTANGTSSVHIDNDGSGLAWTLDDTGYMQHSPMAQVSTLTFDNTALHVKAILEGLQSIADGDLDVQPQADDSDLYVCGNCGFIDATVQGCGACGATAEDMAGWYATIRSSAAYWLATPPPS